MKCQEIQEHLKIPELTVGGNEKNSLPPLKLTARTCKLMVGRLIIFLLRRLPGRGELLVSGGVDSWICFLNQFSPFADPTQMDPPPSGHDP